MIEIKVNRNEETAVSWQFAVELFEGEESLSYEVILDKDYWQSLTGGKVEPEDLVEKSFEFLLEREPKEMILKSFNLKIISKYFPEYEKEII